MALAAHIAKNKITVISGRYGPQWKVKNHSDNLNLPDNYMVKDAFKEGGLQWNQGLSSYVPRDGTTLPGFLTEPIVKALSKNKPRVEFDFKAYAGGPSITAAEVRACPFVCAAVGPHHARALPMVRARRYTCWQAVKNFYEWPNGVPSDDDDDPLGINDVVERNTNLLEARRAAASRPSTDAQFADEDHVLSDSFDKGNLGETSGATSGVADDGEPEDARRRRWRLQLRLAGADPAEPEDEPPAAKRTSSGGKRASSACASPATERPVAKRKPRQPKPQE